MSFSGKTYKNDGVEFEDLDDRQAIDNVMNKVEEHVMNKTSIMIDK